MGLAAVGWQEEVFFQSTYVKSYPAERLNLSSFKFLNFWVRLREVVQQAWDINVSGDPMRILILKLKQVKSALKMWSCERIGDIFSNLATAESEVNLIEEEVRECSSEENLLRLNKA